MHGLQQHQILSTIKQNKILKHPGHWSVSLSALFFCSLKHLCQNTPVIFFFWALKLKSHVLCSLVSWCWEKGEIRSTKSNPGSFEKHACGNISLKWYYIAAKSPVQESCVQFYTKVMNVNLATFHYFGCCTIMAVLKFSVQWVELKG